MYFIIIIAMCGVSPPCQGKKFTSFLLRLILCLDTVETFFDSHVDLFQRRLQQHSDKLKAKAEEILKMRDFSSTGDHVMENFEKEVKVFKLKVLIVENTLLCTARQFCPFCFRFLLEWRNF